VTRAAILADAKRCLAQARKRLATMRAANVDTTGESLDARLAASRVHRAEQAVRAWEEEVSEREAAMPRREKMP